jgi:hypothetical protein
VPRFYSFDAAPDLGAALARSRGTGVELAVKSVVRQYPEEKPGIWGGLGFQFGTYLGLKGSAAFITDIATDPLTYVPIFSLLNKGLRGIAGLTKAGLAARASKDVLLGINKHPAGAKLFKALFDDAVEVGVRDGLTVGQQVLNMKHGFQTAAALAGNEEALALVKQGDELFQQAQKLTGKAKRRALNEVERIMSKARKVIRNDANAGRLAADVFSTKNVQGFGHAIRMRQDAILEPLGETMLQQAQRGQRKLLHAYMPFSELWTKTGAPQEVFSVTAAPLFGVADAVAGLGKVAAKPIRTGIHALDSAARAISLTSKVPAQTTVTADDLVLSANRAIEGATGRRFTALRQQGNKLVGPGVRATADAPEQVFIMGAEGKTIPFLKATATDRMQAALHGAPDAEVVVDNFVAAIDEAKFNVERFANEARTMIQQVHGGGDVGAKMEAARSRLFTLAWQSEAEEGLPNAAGLIPTVTERLSETGIKVPLVQFARPGADVPITSGGAVLNRALDVASGIEPAKVAQAVTDEEVFLINVMAEGFNRMGLELANEGLLDEFVKIYGPRIGQLTPKGKAAKVKGLGKITAGIGAAAEDATLPEEIAGLVKSAFSFSPPTAAAGKSFLKQRRAAWDTLMQMERDGLIVMEHDALKVWATYMKSASEALYKHSYLKSLRALGEDAFGRVVMTTKEVEEAGGLMALATQGPKSVRATALSAGKEYQPLWRYVPADSIAGFNTAEQRYFIREDIFEVLDKLPQFKPGGLFLSSDPQSGKFITGLLAINAMSKRAKMVLSQFHKFVLSGSLVSDQGFGLFMRKSFDEGTGQLTSTLNLDVVRGAAAGAVKGAASGAAVGAGIGGAVEGDLEGAARGAVAGGIAATLPGAAYGASKAFARSARAIYGDAADIALLGVKSGVGLELDDAGLTTMSRMTAAMGTTPIPGLTTGGARQRAVVAKMMQPVEFFDDNLWREFFPGAKIAAFSNLYAEAMRENVVRNLGLTSDQVAKNVAAHVNMAMGGLTWRKLGVSPHFRRLLNGMWFAADWTTANLLAARDVFLNMSPSRAALAGSLAGATAEFVVNGYDPDDMTMKGVLAGAVGGLAFRGAAYAFGQKAAKDIVRGTPLEGWMLRNTATPAEMRDIMERATTSYTTKKNLRFVSQRDPEFVAYALDFTKKELEREGKFLPDSLIPPTMNTGADVLRAKYARRYFKNAFIAMMVMGNVANYAMSGHFMWDNKDGYKLDIELPGRDGKGRRMYVHAGKQYLEPFEWMDDPRKRAETKISTLAQTGIALAANEDFMGRPIIVSDGGILTQGLEAASYSITEMFTPIPFEPLAEAALGRKDIKPAVVTALGLPTKTEFRRKGSAAPRFKAPSLARPPAIGRTSLDIRP